MDFHQLLAFAVEHDASDVHIQTGLPPQLRTGGILKGTNLPAVAEEQVRDFILSIAPKRLHDNIEDRMTVGMDFSYAAPGLSRFRCSSYRQLGTPGISMRIIKSRIRSVAELHLPGVINDIALAGRGLTLVTGTTGSGKSPTLAAM